MYGIKERNRTRTTMTVTISPCVLVDEYTSHSTVHGMRYMSKASMLEKIFWITMLTICGLAACYIGYELWLKYRSKPTQLAVKDTHVPLYEFPFPSITICPAVKVKKTKAFEYFSRYTSIDNDTVRTGLVNIMSALSMMQHPTYFRMGRYIRKSKQFLPLFKAINLTDFMLTTLPTCNEIFGRCKWHGQTISCCDSFSLQRTEEGLCYSFNSLTSEAGKHCPLSEVLENEGIVEEDDYMYPGCQLRRNTAVGTVTGLEVFLYKTNKNESLGMGQRDIDGARVMIHTSYQFPNAGDGIWLKSERGRRLNIMITPVITVTSSRVKDLSVETRGCVFPDERDLYIYHVYTQSSCLVQCRMEYILDTCGCHMYFFRKPADGKPLCGIPDLPCIYNNTRHMRMLTPPEGTPGFETRLLEDSLNCSQCIPTCYETTHEIEMESSPDQRSSVWTFHSYLDVAYGNLGAKKYQRDITFAWTDLLVALGGVANLFLGFSILSVVEFVYWAVKICVYALIGAWTAVDMQRPKSEQNMFWKKEFAWSYATVERLALAKSRRLGNIFREYARYCTVHGVQYIFKDNSHLIERCAWLVIVLASFVCASILVHTMWLKFNSSPTVTAVKDTHLALYSLPFPAVNVCPMDKIKRSAALKYVADRTDNATSRNESEIDNFLNVLTLFQHPLYSRMLYYLNNSMQGDFLSKLTGINITDLMLKVMPSCNEVFNACYWIGHAYNCCELFSLQRSEEGFCFSFNSLTSVKKVNCPMFSTLETDENTIQSIKNWECVLRRNTAAGSTSGLQIFFKRFNLTERLKNASTITGQPAVRVQVFYVNEYPESGMGSIVTAKKGTKLSIMVKPFVTISTDAIKHLPVAERFCYFPDEKHLSVTKSYTQKSCLIECRLNYLHEKCQCRPYYFNMLDNRIPICNSVQLQCIAQHNSELRFYSPPTGNVRGFLVTEMRSPLNCSQCLPTCHESVYDLDVDYSLDSLPLARSSYGSVDIFYRNEGAVKYERDVTFGWIDLLGLFLGFSLLTIIEFVYWCIKLLIHQYSVNSTFRNKISPER